VEQLPRGKLPPRSQYATRWQFEQVPHGWKMLFEAKMLKPADFSEWHVVWMLLGHIADEFKQTGMSREEFARLIMLLPEARGTEELK
jgi:hypothetical protein